jgi:hypothetical protein
VSAARSGSASVTRKARRRTAEKRSEECMMGSKKFFVTEATEESQSFTEEGRVRGEKKTFAERVMEPG